MADYSVREATLDDLDVIVRHRLAMFTDMGTVFDAPRIERLFRDWARTMMEAGDYRAWLCLTGTGEVAAGAGITLLKWPPGPSPLAAERIAYVYNVYAEPGHRKRGLARSVMDAIHAWCKANGVAAVALNAAPAAQHLYESQGYRAAPSPMMWKIV
jgi:GNAT superfamily N-acetyltransferase